MVEDTFQLVKMGRTKLIQIFTELHSPSLSEMHGEFRATVLDQGRWAHNIITVLAFNFPGHWVSKSFAPLDELHGVGYNTFRIGGRIKKIYRMRTRIACSKLDGEPSFHLDYRMVAKQDWLPRFTRLSAEVRRLDQSTYLGVGTADFGIKGLLRPQPFLLQGPVSEFDSTVWERPERTGSFESGLQLPV